MKKLQLMARTCGATAILMFFGLLPMSFNTKASIPAPFALESVSTCPTANFSYSGSGYDSPIYFNNLSTPYKTCSWDFGDGSSSTATNPQHTYATPGTYQVRLTVYGDGCAVSYIGTLDVIAG